MGKKSSKLKQETIDTLTTDTYCKFLPIFFFYIFKKKTIVIDSIIFRTRLDASGTEQRPTLPRVHT